MNDGHRIAFTAFSEHSEQSAWLRGHFFGVAMCFAGGLADGT